MQNESIIRKAIADIDENLSAHEDRRVALCLEQAQLAAMIRENIIVRDALLEMVDGTPLKERLAGFARGDHLK